MEFFIIAVVILAVTAVLLFLLDRHFAKEHKRRMAEIDARFEDIRAIITQSRER